MIGIFLVNNEDQVAFAQYGAHQDIAGIRLHEDTGMCIIELQSGEEATLDDVVPEQITAALKDNTHILVAHVDDAGSYLSEYTVPITITQ